MQCPKCGYEPTMSESTASPDQCPSCGVYYAKATAAASRQTPDEREAAERQRLSAQRADRIGTRRPSAPANPVVVVDLQMPFTSMVTFMVKWALASIPAVIILAAVATVAFTMLGALFSSR